MKFTEMDLLAQKIVNRIIPERKKDKWRDCFRYERTIREVQLNEWSEIEEIVSQRLERLINIRTWWKFQRPDFC